MRVGCARALALDDVMIGIFRWNVESRGRAGIEIIFKFFDKNEKISEVEVPSEK